jgi:hypothetical protein
MDATTTSKPIKINRWLPYWAVFQADMHQTMRGWVYRTWMLISILASAGYLLYRVGPYREAGLIQADSVFISDLLRWTLIGGVPLIIVLTVGSISSERGTMADSVLSRGISRYQYFLGKWHARLVTVLGSFFFLGAIWLTASFFLLHKNLNLGGALVALVMVATLLATVISLGVAVSAITHSTVLGITVLWIVLYGAGLLLALVPAPERIPSPDLVLHRLPNIVLGKYDLHFLGQLMLWSMIISVVAAVTGMCFFSRRDV